ncbi:hypothetical protein SUGI_1168650 [Cryptomeria japonica]|uniref:methyltransferase FGSG_00040 n=1 Tax=Cryptomeria japonica TaxID=3369 RepID=UPI002414AB4D|nr:methyltransferase FGSG_00040 [Cryptomeria japonica]GLJ54415.1 hypothetical protein SUGI_1168650 [Cryptomeria japonica]
MQIQDDGKEIRSKANELLLREEWEEAIALYSQYIDHCETQIKFSNNAELKKSVCLALSNRAEARIRLRDLEYALQDVNRALETDPNHNKSLYCKGKILMELDQYSQASHFFRMALQQHPNATEFQESLDKSRRFESQGKTGVYDLSEWVSSGFMGRPPDCAEYLGPVEIRSSDVGYGERGLFATKDVEAGTLLAVTKPVAIARALLPEAYADNARMVIWKDLVTEIERVVKRSTKMLNRIYTLAENDDGDRKKELGVPHIDLFRPNVGYQFETSCDPVDMDRVLGIADLNTLTEKGCTVKRLAADLYCSSENDCVGLWVLPAFVNHSCCPNTARLHVGDALFLHASRDLKAGDELTFAYFDVLLPLGMRRELCKTWSFVCSCHRCELEQSLQENLKDIETDFARICDKGGEMDMTRLAVKLEERLTQLQRRLKAKDRQLIRASFASAYWPMFRSSLLLKRWGRQIPSIETLIDAVTSALPGDETALCAAAAVVDKLKANRGLSSFQEAMDRALRICKALYGKQMKMPVMKALIDAHVRNRGLIMPKS